jgi:hypothetical protein
MDVTGELHAYAALPPGRKFSRYPLDRRLGGPHNRSGHCGVKENLFPLPKIEPRLLGYPACRRSLYLLSYPSTYTCILYTYMYIILEGSSSSIHLDNGGENARRHSDWSKGGRTPTARQASRHETKKIKADVSIMTQTGMGRFSKSHYFNCAPFFASYHRHRVSTVTCLDACQCAGYLKETSSVADGRGST